MKTVLAPNAPWHSFEPPKKPEIKKKSGRSNPEQTDKNYQAWEKKLDCKKVFGDAKKVS